jgi:glycosyltransferase involved in cell wall biosynthesis
VLFLGMLSARKGLDELLAACVQLRHGGNLPFACDIVGGEEVLGARAKYEQAFTAAGLSPWVRFHGPAFGADKLRFLRRAQVFVLPSRAESFGIANLEAMATGLAVVSTRTGAIPEYLENEVQGLLIDPGDASALAAAIARLIADPDLRQRLGTAARLRARDYDWTVIAARLDTMYASVIGSTAPQGVSR